MPSESHARLEAGNVSAARAVAYLFVIAAGLVIGALTGMIAAFMLGLIQITC